MVLNFRNGCCLDLWRNVARKIASAGAHFMFNFFPVRFTRSYVQLSYF